MSGSSSATRTRGRRCWGLHQCLLLSAFLQVDARLGRRHAARQALVRNRTERQGGRLAERTMSHLRRARTAREPWPPGRRRSALRSGDEVRSRHPVCRRARVHRARRPSPRSAGWDMVFSWEAVWGQDAWATLAAAAMVTERVRLGTLLTPAARYRPWDLASRVASVDRLSHGRVTLGVGLGALHGNWLAFEPDEGRAVRAAKLDEVLAIYAGLMGGQPFEFTGEHFSARPVPELIPPMPVQRPHPPVWCVGMLVPGRARQRSLERAARWQGVFPAAAGGTLEDPRLAPHHRGPARGRRPHRHPARRRRADDGGLRRGRRGRQPRVVRWGAPAGAAVGRRRRHLVGRVVVGPARLPRGPRRDPSPARAGPAAVTTADVVVRVATPADAPAMVELRAIMFEAMGTASAAIADPGWRRAAHDWFAERADGRWRTHRRGRGRRGRSCAVRSARSPRSSPAPTWSTARVGLISNVATVHAWRGRGLAAACTDDLLRWFVEQTDVRGSTCSPPRPGRRSTPGAGSRVRGFEAMCLPVPR